MRRFLATRAGWIDGGRGAPIAYVTPENTTGVELQLMVAL